MLLGPFTFLYLVMTKLNYIFEICFTFIALVGCIEQPELSNVVVLGSPKNDSVLCSGDKMRYHLQLLTIHEYVDGLTISSFDIERGTVVCLDTQFTAKNKEMEYDFIYTAPQISRDELDVELSFVVRDNLGNTSKIMRKVTVTNHQRMIEEKSGIVLYAHNAYLPNALSFSDVSQPFVSSYAADSLKADVWLNPYDSLAAITWESETGTKFVRHNDFNYATASVDNLQSTYSSSKRYDAIKDVAINDIIIVGHEESVDGVFFVNNIVYDDKLQSECLQLSFKGVKADK